jgi:hypothetical protein
VNFTKIVSLDEMVGHIYGRGNIMTRKDRPHVFLRELELYIRDFKQQIEEGAPRLAKYENNLRSGIEYYRTLVTEEMADQAEDFIAKLDVLLATVPTLEVAAPAASTVDASA